MYTFLYTVLFICKFIFTCVMFLHTDLSDDAISDVEELSESEQQGQGNGCTRGRGRGKGGKGRGKGKGKGKGRAAAPGGGAAKAKRGRPAGNRSRTAGPARGGNARADPSAQPARAVNAGDGADGDGPASVRATDRRERSGGAQQEIQQPKNVLPEGSIDEFLLPGEKVKKKVLIDLYDNCTEPVGPTLYAEGMSHLDIFEHFFNNEVVDLILRETNKYARQAKKVCYNYLHYATSNISYSQIPNLGLTKDELFSFLGIVIAMGVSPQPRLQDHWSRHPVLNSPYITRNMINKRFRNILSSLHFNDTSNPDETPQMNREDPR